MAVLWKQCVSFYVHIFCYILCKMGHKDWPTLFRPILFLFVGSRECLYSFKLHETLIWNHCDWSGHSQHWMHLHIPAFRNVCFVRVNVEISINKLYIVLNIQVIYNEHCKPWHDGCKLHKHFFPLFFFSPFSSFPPSLCGWMFLQTVVNCRSFWYAHVS